MMMIVMMIKLNINLCYNTVLLKDNAANTRKCVCIEPIRCISSVLTSQEFQLLDLELKTKVAKQSCATEYNCTD